MGKPKPDCTKCMYRAVNRMWLCNYETVTGHTRKAVPAKKCTHFKEGEPARQTGQELLEKLWSAENQENKKRTGPKEKYDWSIAKQMYDDGMNDGKIAEAMGCYRSVVRLWRKRNDLPANTEAGWRGKKEKYDWKKGRQLYDEGKGDGAIGKELGCSSKAVRAWRKRWGLPARLEPGGQRKEKTK